MKEIHKYNIGIAKLKDKKHEFSFDLNDSFFSLFDQSLINGGDLKADVTLDKTELLITLDFNIRGDLNLTCDRTLEEFAYPVDIQETLLVRFGAEELELADNAIQITPDTTTLNVAQHIFDYLGLAVPMKKLHPRCVAEDRQREQDEGAEVMHIFSTKPAPGSEEGEGGDDDGSADPRWDALKKFK
ncbi:DUF177 domain-containing protein [soil metagenome]